MAHCEERRSYYDGSSPLKKVCLYTLQKCWVYSSFSIGGGLRNTLSKLVIQHCMRVNYPWLPFLVRWSCGWCPTRRALWPAACVWTCGAAGVSQYQGSTRGSIGHVATAASLMCALKVATMATITVCVNATWGHSLTCCMYPLWPWNM